MQTHQKGSCDILAGGDGASTDRIVVTVGGKRELAQLEPTDVAVRLQDAATHRDLKVRSEDRLFRPDLYYRQNVFAIYLSPLRATMTGPTLPGFEKTETCGYATIGF